ncbi:MAG: TolC family protein [Planctomycetota bacterium]
MNHPTARGITTAAALTASASLVFLSGCAAPLSGPEADDRLATLRRSIVESVSRELVEAESRPDRRATQREPGEAQLGLTDERIKELDEFSGPAAYGKPLDELPLAEDLLGQPQRVVSVSLEHAIQSAVRSNLDLQFASLNPAISAADLTVSEAAFDWVFFNTLTYQVTDRESAIIAGGVPPITETTFWQNETGFQRTLRTGGQLTIQQTISDTRDDSPGGTTRGTFGESDVQLRLDQPLLRGFGTEASLAQIRINRNLERNAIASLRQTMIETVRQTEEAYWRLFQAHRDLLVVQQLLERGIRIANQVEQRRLLDATPAQIADANSRVESRKAQVLRSQQALRDASNRLKLLINDPRLTIGSEILLIPADQAVDQAIQFSLADAITTAVRHRPEIEIATLNIDDASIRERFARNEELPLLNLGLQANFLGLDESLEEAYDESFGGSFIGYLMTLAFEQPIGNRAAAATTRRRRLERLQTAVNFRDVVQQVLFEIKTSLDTLNLNYRLIEQTRVSRLSAAESLRALLVEKETIAGFTVERLDLELTRQEALAISEQEETLALADYNIAVANYYASIGRLLERNRIEFVVPDASESFDRVGRLLDGAP